MQLLAVVVEINLRRAFRKTVDVYVGTQNVPRKRKIHQSYQEYA